MKIPALLTFLLAAVLSALPVSQARADDVSFDVFYNSLGDQGDWYNTPEYGYVWQPSIAYQNDKWRPYSDGYWAQTDDGWTWVSYENFGWATYHYGRWTQLEDTGWVWVPGYQWGPGWVSWRTNDDYVGWAPLPPKAHSGGGQGSGNISIDYNDVEPEEGYTSNVDADYDIGPSHYCFVPVHAFGAPVLTQVILPPAQNITIIEHTTNVTNIIYQNGGGNVVVINNGPNYQYLSHHVDHPLQHLILEHHTDINYLHEHLKGGTNPTLVKNGTLFVPTPYIEHRRMDFNQVKPPTVKRDIRDARVEHGWRNTGADQQTVDRVRQQFQQQAREHPTRPPGNPAANMTPPIDPRQRERDARTNAVPTPPADPRQRERDARTNAVPAPAATPVASVPLPHGNSDADKRARRDAAQRERDARTGRHDDGQPTPPPVASRPGSEPGNTPIRPPNTPPLNVPHQPDAQNAPTAPTPKVPREMNPDRDPRSRNKPANTPATTPRVDAEHDERRNQPSSEPKTVTPSAPTEEPRHAPRQPERTQPTAAPTRETAPEVERHPVRTQETAPPAPRPEARESQPRPEARESQPRPAAPPAAPRQEVRETKPEPQPAGTTDPRKKHDN